MVENFCPDLPGYYLKYMKFVWLILRKVNKILVTKMHQIRFRLGSTPDPARVAYSAPQTRSWIGGAYL